MSYCIRAKAPLRLSFAGGGTDVPPFPEREGGCVLSATLDQYAYGTLRPRSDKKIQLESVDFGLALEMDVNEPLPYDGKLDLFKAAIKKLDGHASDGFDLLLQCDVPPGSGLGSSSTVMVVLVGLLKEFKQLSLNDYEVAHLAYEIERKDLGIHGGLQDQYAATFGGFNYIEFLGDRVAVNPVPISPDVINELEHNLLLCDSGKTRFSEKVIDDRVRRYTEGDADNLQGLHRQKELAGEMRDALLQRRLETFGELLHQSWEYKKMMSPKISNPSMDEIYEEARKHGAIGGKLMGAGGGGFMLLYCPFEKKHKVAGALVRMEKKVRGVAFEPHGLQTWSMD